MPLGQRLERVKEADEAEGGGVRRSRPLPSPLRVYGPGAERNRFGAEKSFAQRRALSPK